MHTYSLKKIWLGNKYVYVYYIPEFLKMYILIFTSKCSLYYHILCFLYGEIVTTVGVHIFL